MSLQQAPPRLTRLEMHGFKSFANRTVFQFEPGITAIIGPNGSGKSNISDAVRWVLGEQSHASLRSKKTDDVIFAGGHGKSPSGMAEVTVTFDNDTGWLPIDFSEVTVTRRAYRDGENQYLINGRRVRLKDVAQLTATLGQSHTVVGQGLVDAALSQRAEERRTLFEHAADLTGLRMKAAEAMKNLAETEINSARISDLLTELEPRLRGLERAAKQAREWQGMHDRLRTIQRHHFAERLAAAVAAVETAVQGSAAETALVDLARESVEQLQMRLAEARALSESARDALAAHAARQQATTEQHRRAGHERDLAHERHVALTRRREDMADTQAGLDDQVAAVERDLATIASEVDVVATEYDAARRQLTELQASAAAGRREREAHEREAAAADRAIHDAERRLIELNRRRALLEQRRETDVAERERLTRAIAERLDRSRQLEQELGAFETVDGETRAAIGEVESRVSELERRVAATTNEGAAARATAAAIERKAGEARSRLDALQRIHESGAGLHQGVRETLRAAKSGKLGGVRGTLAELVSLPPAYDTAIEVALGGHLQDIVVERWADAEAAIQHLKRTNAGRATFQPLDSVRGSTGASVPAALAGLPGHHGIASDLLASEPALRPVLSSLIGRTLIVDDLAAARAALPHLPPGWSVVTLAGEIARSAGSVTGGSAVRESGVLGRERDLRELPATVARLESEWATAVASVSARQAELAKLAAERQRCEGELAAHIASRRERHSQKTRLTQWRSEIDREHEALQAQLNGLQKAAERLGADLIGLAGEEDAAAGELAASKERRAELALALEQLTTRLDASDEALNDAARRLAALEERRRAAAQRESSLLAQRDNLTQELALRATRAASLDGEIVAVASERDRLAVEFEALATALAEIEAGRPPLEAAKNDGEREIAGFEAALDRARSDLLDAERNRGTSGLAVERARGELLAIRQRIADELDLDDPDTLAPPDGESIADLPRGDDAEREIARLKERLRRVGYAGEDVVEEYDRESKRHAFLREQLADVHGAAASLTRLLDELHETMRTRFEETFGRVSICFSEMFTGLFGGGTARLVLTAGDDGETAGVDIVAQPPGKRLRSLALLSGGERALTAVALLFAILKVNPTPFCLLDEVDAALDEANVVRFREQLQALAAETQAIVITHNRGTVEVAGTLYGVSMRDDGVSQVLSLRLSDAVIGA